jgi:hypothetical protein
MTSFQFRLDEWLIQIGAEPNELARKMGVSNRRFDLWRRGCLPDDDELVLLAALLHIDPRCLFCIPNDLGAMLRSTLQPVEKFLLFRRLEYLAD